jgi:hypothetical protein
MIGSLGTQKLVILAVLVLILGAIYFYGIAILGPQNDVVDRQLRASQAEFSEVTGNMDRLVSDLDYFDKHKDQFKDLEILGFFNSQNRLEVRARLNEMEVESRLISSLYNANSAEVEENEKATKAGYKIVKTPIEFNLEAIEDADIYKFIYLLNYGFAGHISITELSLVRNKKITPTLLQKIGNGELVSVVTANLKIELRTMVEDPLASSALDNEGRKY